MSDKRKEAQRLCLEKGLTQDAAAQKLGVSRRTVERWASEDGWGVTKKAQKVISIAEGKKPKSVNSDPTPPRNPAPRRSRGSGDIDELEIITIAISDASALMSGDIDPKGFSSCATALCRLIELRLKLKPRSAAEVVELAINLGIPPHEFVAELERSWQLRA